MRRFVPACIFLFALSVPLRADKVPPQKAAAVAERFLSAESPATKASGTSLRLRGTWPQAQTKGETQEPALYLFERDGGGYAVVAADDVSLPIIGYSLTDRLPQDKLPCNLRYMLDWHASMIDYARKHHLEASADTRAQWQSVQTNDEEEVLLETARWDQTGLPWNALVPTLDGKECHAGCVATAMAIVMRYHQWPEKGTGTLPSYYWYSGRKEIEGHALGHVYDWSQMPLVYEPGQYTQEQADQVAQLLYDLAIMSEMDFSPWGSGAAGDCPFRLTQYFGYDKQMRLSEADYYSMEVWEQMIRDEINLARPIFYFGYDKDWEGHAFVVDGYKGHYFSINYGWSGFGNDFYLLKPSVDLDPHAVTDFTLWPGMITHIFPDQGGETVPQFTDDELVAFPWDFRSKSFPVGGRLLTAYSSEETEVRMGFVLFDRKGRFKEATTGEPVLVSTRNPYIPELTCH
ncbi:MAG: C10 family peptidase, partial [Bacteroidales bacterium]|nr:C10 family peptidase [Bacteroidales bacterium]